MIRQLFESTEFMLALVIGSFLAGRWVYMKTKFPLFHPVIIAIVIIVLFLRIFNIDYQVFAEGSSFINFLLGPTVVALGYLLYEQMQLLKQNTVSILVSVFSGCIAGIFSVVVLAQLMGADNLLLLSMEPKSVTTPIALSIVEQTGGNVSLTAVIVVICGIYGSVVGVPVMKMLGIESSVARGLALGASAHGIGTARAMELGVTEGAVGGLAIGLMGVMTAVLIPVLHSLMAFL